eukprot:scaffold59488_cov33-Tisochrysis_lutea.AAC.2
MSACVRMCECKGIYPNPVPAKVRLSLRVLPALLLAFAAPACAAVDMRVLLALLTIAGKCRSGPRCDNEEDAREWRNDRRERGNPPARWGRTIQRGGGHPRAHGAGVEPDGVMHR